MAFFNASGTSINNTGTVSGINFHKSWRANIRPWRWNLIQRKPFSCHQFMDIKNGLLFLFSYFLFNFFFWMCEKHIYINDINSEFLQEQKTKYKNIIKRRMLVYMILIFRLTVSTKKPIKKLGVFNFMSLCLFKTDYYIQTFTVNPLT